MEFRRGKSLPGVEARTRMLERSTLMNHVDFKTGLTLVCAVRIWGGVLAGCSLSLSLSLGLQDGWGGVDFTSIRKINPMKRSTHAIMVSHLRGVLAWTVLLSLPSFSDEAFVVPGGEASSVNTPPLPSGFGPLCRDLTDLKTGRLIAI